MAEKMPQVVPEVREAGNRCGATNVPDYGVIPFGGVFFLNGKFGAVVPKAVWNSYDVCSEKGQRRAPSFAACGIETAIHHKSHRTQCQAGVRHLLPLAALKLGREIALADDIVGKACAIFCRLRH